MTIGPSKQGRDRFVREVLQTSNMDCGPAALAAWLSSSGLPISYARLREACQTDIDGTSIDAMEDLVNRLGLPAEQVMVPIDAVFSKALPNLPCIAVVLLPNRLTHFVVLWREVLGWVQVMDPAQGRVWLRKSEVQRRLFEHETAVPAADWVDYAMSDEFASMLQDMAYRLGLPPEFLAAHLETLGKESHWRPWACIDAALRCANRLQAQGVKLTGLRWQDTLQVLLDSPEFIPVHCWQVNENQPLSELDEPQLNLRGAVLLRAAAGSPDKVATDPSNALQCALLDQGAQTSPNDEAPDRIAKPAVSILRRLVSLVPGSLVSALVGCALLVGALAFVEALVFRVLVSSPVPPGWIEATLFAGAVLAPFALGLGLFAVANHSARVAGRHVEMRLRAALMQHLPLIPDRYFASRLINDLAERGHALALLGRAPLLLQRSLILAMRLLGILLGLGIVLPGHWWVVGGAGLAVVALPWIAYPWLRDLDMRVRTHASAAGQIYLDALRGSEAVAAHGARQPLEFESESRFKQWYQAYQRSGTVALVVEAAQLVLLLGAAVLLLDGALTSGAPLGVVLLVAYWSLFLPIVSRQLMLLLREYPTVRNVAARVFEVLDSPTEIASANQPQPKPVMGPVALTWREVQVSYAERPVLRDLNLEIAAGEQVAIVGQSGSGKSSFLALLQGWLPAQRGELQADGVALDPEGLAALREQSVVVDSQMYLWNRALVDNVLFGHEEYRSEDLELAIRQSQVQLDLERYPQGLAQPVGENGGRLSGGQAQRVRVARGLLNRNPRLVLLDEPFVGMSSSQRTELRQAVLARWPHSTMLFVVHDLHEVQDFSRVLVIDEGRIVEDGSPRNLAQDKRSAFAHLLADEAALRERLFTGSQWQHLRIIEQAVRG